MVESSINFIVSQLNQALKNRYALDDEIVVVSNISETTSQITNDRMVATLVNIERDTYPATPNRSPYVHQEATGKSHRPINLNLYLMFVANFPGDKYQEGLKFISTTIEFFQNNPAFDRNRYHTMPTGIEKLLLEMENLDLREIHSIWTLITGNYMPSILFKVRTISFDQGIQGVSPVTRSVENSTGAPAGAMGGG